ncbi:MAG: GNAT family N-acetyltransferase [Pseudomonadota bacterium]
MLNTLAQGGIIGLLAMGGLAWGFARVLDAPAWVVRSIPLVLVVIVMLAQILLPVDAPFRQTTGAALQAVFWLAVAAVPVLGYRWLLRQARIRAGTAPEAPKTGFVLIEEDAALMEEISARLSAANRAAAPWDRQTFSVAHRDPSGRIVAAGQVRLNMGLAELRRVWVDPDRRGRGLGAELVGHLEDAARDRGAKRALLDTYSWQAQGFYEKLGYTRFAEVDYPAGPRLIYMKKDLG